MTSKPHASLFIAIIILVSSGGFSNVLRAADDGIPWEIQGTINASSPRSLLAVNESKQPVRVGDRTVRPRLCVRQKITGYDAFISFETYVGHDDPTLLIQFDNEKPESVVWKSSGSDRNASPEDPDAFVYRLLRHKKLRVEFTPPGELPVEMEFNLFGLSQVLQGAELPH